MALAASIVGYASLGLAAWLALFLPLYVLLNEPVRTEHGD